MRFLGAPQPRGEETVGDSPTLGPTVEQPQRLQAVERGFGHGVDLSRGLAGGERPQQLALEIRQQIEIDREKVWKYAVGGHLAERLAEVSELVKAPAEDL